ncbi:Ribonuclease D [hydrothermal vent metagenome]|uniref:Ribonuclease D n=1 Tax=hydrothermal vent metagenome TaxID=652676 RepID=A0A1W1E0P1_9ZZZZ
MQLSAWREHQAIDKNKPRRWIMTDNYLIDVTMEKQQLSNNKQQKFEEFLVANPHTITPDIPQHTPTTAKEKEQKLILQKLIQEKATQYNLTTEVIASSKTLLRYIRGDQSVNFLSGWRYHLLKKELEKCKIV